MDAAKLVTRSTEEENVTVHILEFKPTQAVVGVRKRCGENNTTRTRAALSPLRRLYNIPVSTKCVRAGGQTAT